MGEEENEKNSKELQVTESDLGKLTEPESSSESESEPEEQEPKPEEQEPNPVQMAEELLPYLTNKYSAYQSNVYCELDNKYDLLIKKLKDLEKEKENIKSSDPNNLLLFDKEDENNNIIYRDFLEQKCIFI